MGRPFGSKDIQTPEELWTMFMEYTDSLETLEQEVPHVKLGTVKISTKEPMTMEGFKCFGHTKGITLDHYIKNSGDAYTDFCPIVTRIKETIFKNNFSRASVGIYKENLIARQLGIGDKSQVDSDVKITGLPINIMNNTLPLANDEK